MFPWLCLIAFGGNSCFHRLYPSGITADTEYSSAYSVENLLDDNYATYWISANGDTYDSVYIDFANDVDVMHITIREGTNWISEIYIYDGITSQTMTYTESDDPEDYKIYNFWFSEFITRSVRIYFSGSQGNILTVSTISFWGCNMTITAAPTVSPTMMPTNSTPTVHPTILPSVSPSQMPTNYTPSVQPTISPTLSPAMRPTIQPTVSPTMMPTNSTPTVHPTILPSVSPSQMPTNYTPSVQPTISPTLSPAMRPTIQPTVSPTMMPTNSTPTVHPTILPSVSPSQMPTKYSPTMPPTIQPTSSPSMSPTSTLVPSSSPTMTPTSSLLPTLSPTIPPTSESTGSIDEGTVTTAPDRDHFFTIGVIEVLGVLLSLLVVAVLYMCVKQHRSKKKFESVNLMQMQGTHDMPDKL